MAEPPAEKPGPEPLNKDEVLFKIYPNPVDQRTEIYVRLPEGTGRGMVIINELDGRQITAVNVSNGEKRIKLDATELSPGMCLSRLRMDGSKDRLLKFIIQ